MPWVVFTTGKKTSSNIVTDQRLCEEIAVKISRVDDKIGRCLHQIALEIEAMCQTSYNLPQTIPRCINITSITKNSLGEFRELAEEAIGLIRSHARDVTEIQ